MKTVARVGPTSRISSRKATKANAVQITPRAAREIRAEEEGSADGRVRAAAGAYTIADRSRTGAISWSVGTCFRWRAMIRGAVA
nr:hypothetical protein [Streptomyces phaeolivaceus]